MSRNEIKKWRFRTNLFGKLILQKLVSWNEDFHDYEQWVDAEVEDLINYYEDMNNVSQ